MSTIASGLGPLPPLRFSWQSSASLALAVGNGQEIYGVTHEGKVVSIAPTTGQVRWQTSETYLKHRLTASGNKVFAFRQDVGLVAITDKGTTFDEKVLISIDPLREGEVISEIIEDNTNGPVYIAKDQALVAVSPTGTLLGATAAGPETPHSTYTVDPGRVLTVDGYGFPSLWEFDGTAFKRKWQSVFPGLGPQRSERSAIVAGNLVVCSQETGIACVRLETGATVWRDSRYTGRAFAVTHMEGPSQDKRFDLSRFENCLGF